MEPFNIQNLKEEIKILENDVEEKKSATWKAAKESAKLNYVLDLVKAAPEFCFYRNIFNEFNRSYSCNDIQELFANLSNREEFLTKLNDEINNYTMEEVIEELTCLQKLFNKFEDSVYNQLSKFNDPTEISFFNCFKLDETQKKLIFALKKCKKEETTTLRKK